MELFFNKYFKAYSQEALDKFGMTEKVLMEVIAVFMNLTVYMPKRTEEYKRITGYVRKALKSFSLPTYSHLFQFEPVQCLFYLLKISGSIDEIIGSKPNLKTREATYLRAVDCIINFKNSPILIE